MVEYSSYDLFDLENVANRQQLEEQYKHLISQFTSEEAPKEFLEIQGAYKSLMKASEEFELGTEYPKTFPLYQSVNDYFEIANSKGLEQEKIIAVLTSVFETPFDTQKEILTFLESGKPKI